MQDFSKPHNSPSDPKGEKSETTWGDILLWSSNNFY